MTFINYENQLLQLDTNQTTYYAAVNRHLNENKAGEVNIKEQAIYDSIWTVSKV